MPRKKTSASDRGTALIPIEKGGPVPIAGTLLSKIPGDEGAVAREGGVTLVTGRAYATDDYLVPAAEIYFDDRAKPLEDGVWLHEADKVSWRDPTSGFECIMMRDADGGFLSGYVGVPRDHPLWGWDEDAIEAADLGIEVHGGLNYSAICQDGPSPHRSLIMEARRICHAPSSPARYKPLKHATDHRVEDPHAWWIGFSCDHLYDEVPKSLTHPKKFLAAETERVYRDDTYVVREIRNLAAQLRAIADGEPVPPRRGPPLPPISLDPNRGS